MFGTLPRHHIQTCAVLIQTTVYISLYYSFIKSLVVLVMLCYSLICYKLLKYVITDATTTTESTVETIANHTVPALAYYIEGKDEPINTQYQVGFNRNIFSFVKERHHHEFVATNGITIKCHNKYDNDMSGDIIKFDNYVKSGKIKISDDDDKTWSKHFIKNIDRIKIAFQDLDIEYLHQEKLP